MYSRCEVLLLHFLYEQGSLRVPHRPCKVVATIVEALHHVVNDSVILAVYNGLGIVE